MGSSAGILPVFLITANVAGGYPGAKIGYTLHREGGRKEGEDPHFADSVIFDREAYRMYRQGTTTSARGPTQMAAWLSLWYKSSFPFVPGGREGGCAWVKRRFKEGGWTGGGIAGLGRGVAHVIWPPLPSSLSDELDSPSGSHGAGRKVLPHPALTWPPLFLLGLCPTYTHPPPCAACPGST